MGIPSPLFYACNLLTEWVGSVEFPIVWIELTIFLVSLDMCYNLFLT